MYVYEHALRRAIVASCKTILSSSVARGDNTRPDRERGITMDWVVLLSFFFSMNNQFEQKPHQQQKMKHFGAYMTIYTIIIMIMIII